MKMNSRHFAIESATPVEIDPGQLKAALADMARIATRAATGYPAEQRVEALAILKSARASIDRINGAQ